MALSIKQAIALGVIGAAGIGMVVTGTRSLMKSNERKEAEELRERQLRAHNQIHSEEYAMTHVEYMERFAQAFRYVHSYRHGHVPNTDRYVVLLSQFAVILHEDVAMLLAAGIASTHMFADYSDVFKDQKLIWCPAQTRYTTVTDFIDGKVDSVDLSFQPVDLVSEATYIRHQVNTHRELRVCAFIKDQAEVINKILDGNLEVPNEKAA